MYHDLGSFDDIKKWVMIEITGNDNPDEAYFEVPLNDKELQQIIDNTLRDMMKWLLDGVSEGYYVLLTEPKKTLYTLPKKILYLPYEYRVDPPTSASIDYTDFVRSGVFYMGGNAVYSNQLEQNLMAYYMQQNIVIQNIRNLFKPMGQYSYNIFTHEVMLMIPPIYNGFKIYKCLYSDLVDEGTGEMEFGDYFNEPMIRKLLLSRCKKKIGWNGKTIDSIAVGNYKIDYKSMYDDASKEEDELMKELKGQGDVTVWSIG